MPNIIEAVNAYIDYPLMKNLPFEPKLHEKLVQGESRTNQSIESIQTQWVDSVYINQRV